MRLEDRCIKCGPNWDVCRCWADALRAELAQSKEHIRMLREAILERVQDHCPDCKSHHSPSREELVSTARFNRAIAFTESLHAHRY